MHVLVQKHPGFTGAGDKLAKAYLCCNYLTSGLWWNFRNSPTLSWAGPKKSFQFLDSASLISDNQKTKHCSCFWGFELFSSAGAGMSWIPQNLDAYCPRGLLWKRRNQRERLFPSLLWQERFLFCLGTAWPAQRHPLGAAQIITAPKSQNIAVLGLDFKPGVCWTVP